MNIAYIIRGLPGSAKSTIATELAKAAIADGKSVIVHTTDDYHMIDGMYRYNPDKTSKYHKKNLLAFQRSCHKGINVVICPNTNINKDQYGIYEAYAKKCGYHVFKIIMDAFDTKKASHYTVHKVPETIIQKMKQNFEICGKRIFPKT